MCKKKLRTLAKVKQMLDLRLENDHDPVGDLDSDDKTGGDT